MAEILCRTDITEQRPRTGLRPLQPIVANIFSVLVAARPHRLMLYYSAANDDYCCTTVCVSPDLCGAECAQLPTLVSDAVPPRVKHSQ